MTDWKNKIYLRLPAIALLSAMVLFWSQYDRYEPDGPILFSSPNHSDATRIWGDCTGDDGRYVLHVGPDGQMAQMNFRIADAEHRKRFRIRALMKLDGVVKGEYPWNCARLILLQYDAEEQWMPGEHGVVAEEGTTDWTVHEDVFDIFPDAEHVDVVLQHMGKSGTVIFDHIEVQPVRIKRSFWGWQVLSIGLWLVAGIYYFPRCRLNSRKLKVLITLNVIAILAGTLIPGMWISSRVEQIKDVAVQILSSSDTDDAVDSHPPIDGWSANPVRVKIDRFGTAFGQVHEVGHFVLFASLFLLVYLSGALEWKRPIYFFKVGFDVMLFAGITEALQFLTLDRSASMGDLLTDLYGMATALVLFLCILPLVHRRLTNV